MRLRLEKIASYIGKYIGKGYEYEALNIKNSFTASQIKQIYKLSIKRLAVIWHAYGKEAEGLKCSYRKVYELVERRQFYECLTCKKFGY